MFGIDAIEFVLLLVLAVVVFGPEKLPDMSRKAARVFVYLRDVANSAQTQLRSELGPEYSDLELKDLHPKTFVAKHMRAEVDAIEQTKRDLKSAQDQVKDTAALATSQASETQDDAKAALTAKPSAAATVPFDDEAT